jgi:predicted nucleic acid-binding protein
MNVVSNASPLIALIRIGQLDLLRQLYGTIALPEAVWHEVVVEGADQPGVEAVRSASWIVRRTVTNRPLVHGLQQELDAGEAEAIALAVEIDDAWLLMDERLDETPHGISAYATLGWWASSSKPSIRGLSRPFSLFWMPCVTSLASV